MSDDYRRIEVITGSARRRNWNTRDKPQMIEVLDLPGESVSSVARRHGVAPNLLYRWRRLMTEGGAVAVDADDQVTSNQDVRKLEERIRELERLLGRKAMEVEILKTPWQNHSQNNRPCCQHRYRRTFCDEDDRPDA